MHHRLNLKTCLEVARDLDDYLKRELTAEDEKRIEEHLSLCAECVRHFRFEELFMERVRSIGRSTHAPPQLRDRLARMWREA